MKKLKTKNKIIIIVLILVIIIILIEIINNIQNIKKINTELLAAGTIYMENIGVSIVENNNIVAWRNYGDSGQWNENKGNLFYKMIGEGENLVIGKKYANEIKIRNTGAIDEYVRVTINKNWVDESENIIRMLEPQRIELQIPDESSNWIKDENSSNNSKTIFYYKKPLLKGQDTEPILNAIKISPNTINNYTYTKAVTADGEIITTKNNYDGIRFKIDIEVAAVQNNNAEDAILSAWGKIVEISADGTLRLLE